MGRSRDVVDVQNNLRGGGGVPALTVRAWQAVSDPSTTYTAETLELLVQTAELRLTADVGPTIDTLRIIRNAHSVWHRLRDDDPETALEFAAPILALLHDHPRRTRDVIEWAASRR